MFIYLDVFIVSPGGLPTGLQAMAGEYLENPEAGRGEASSPAPPLSYCAGIFQGCRHAGRPVS
ncbi:MAG: hypothetical protein ACOY41_05490 [Pseudomonadota bacterium]